MVWHFESQMCAKNKTQDSYGAGWLMTLPILWGLLELQGVWGLLSEDKRVGWRHYLPHHQQSETSESNTGAPSGGGYHLTPNTAPPVPRKSIFTITGFFLLIQAYFNKQIKPHLVKVLNISHCKQGGALKRPDQRERAAKTQQQSAHSVQQKHFLKFQALDNVWSLFNIALLLGTGNIRNFQNNQRQKLRQNNKMEEFSLKERSRRSHSQMIAQKISVQAVSLNKNLEQQSWDYWLEKQNWRHHDFGFQAILQSGSCQDSMSWCKKRHPDPVSYTHLTLPTTPYV